MAVSPTAAAMEAMASFAVNKIAMQTAFDSAAALAYTVSRTRGRT